MKPTFKKWDRTGRYASFQPKGTNIKVRGRGECGHIVCDRTSNEWCIRLMVAKDPTKEGPAPFRWITLKFRGNDEESARSFVVRHWDSITERYPIHYFS